MAIPRIALPKLNLLNAAIASTRNLFLFACIPLMVSHLFLIFVVNRLIPHDFGMHAPPLINNEETLKDKTGKLLSFASFLNYVPLLA